MTLSEDRTLTLKDLPFQADTDLEVILLERAAPNGVASDEAEHVADWFAASERSLRAVWDNEEDAEYDRL